MTLLLFAFLAAGKATEFRPTVAVVPPVSTVAADGWVGLALADDLSTRLLFHSRFDPKTLSRLYPLNVFGWRQALSAARAAGLRVQEPLDKASLARLNADLGADFVLAGTYQIKEKVVTLNWQLFGDGTSARHTSVFAIDKVALGAEKIAAELLVALGQTNKVLESHSLPVLSLAAVKPYGEALQILSRQSLDPRAHLVLPRDEVEKARTLLTAATDADHSFVRAWVARGVTSAMLGETADAEQALVHSMEVAAEFEPDMALGLYYLYERQGEAGKAITVLDEATTTHLGFLQALGYLGQQYARNAQNHDALRVFTTFKARVPKSPWAAIKRAEALAHIGNQDQAIVETQEVVAKFPDSVAALTALASRQIDAVKYDDARATITRAMKLAPDHPALLTRLSYIALEQDKVQEALDLAQKAVITIGDGRGEMIAGYAHLDLGHALARMGRTDEAFVALGRAKELGVDADDLLVFWRDARLEDFMNDARNPFRPLVAEPVR